MQLRVSPFPGCCGSVVIHGFPADGYIREGIQEVLRKPYIDERDKSLKNLFRERRDDLSLGNAPFLKNVGFIHAVLNHKQMLNEPCLFELGFQKIDSTVNKNTDNVIHHYLKINNKPEPIPPKVKPVKKLFMNKSTVTTRVEMEIVA